MTDERDCRETDTAEEHSDTDDASDDGGGQTRPHVKPYQREDWLRRKRDQGWTQEQIADWCDISQGTVSNWARRLGVSFNGHCRGGVEGD